MDESGRNGYEPNRIDLISRLSSPLFIALIRYLYVQDVIRTEKRTTATTGSWVSHNINKTNNSSVHLPYKAESLPPTTTTFPFLPSLSLAFVFFLHGYTLCIHVCLCCCCCWCFFFFTSVPPANFVYCFLCTWLYIYFCPLFN